MAGPWTTDDLLALAKLTPFWPDSGGPLTDAELLRIADSLLQSSVFPMVLKATEGAWRSKNLDTSIAASTASYRMPSRAHAGRLYDVVYVDSNSNERSLPIISEEEAAHYYSDNGTSGPSRFYIKDGDVVLLPTPTSATGTLRQKYPMRPGKLVATSAASTPATAKIVTIGAAASGGGTERRFTFDTVPTAWTSGDAVDIVRADGVFETSHIDLTSADVVTGASGTIDVEEAVLDTTKIAVGDYFCLAGESCIPQVPDVAHPYLAQLLSVRMCMAMQNKTGIQVESATAEMMKRDLLELLEPRVDGETGVVVPHYSPLRQMTATGSRWP